MLEEERGRSRASGAQGQKRGGRKEEWQDGALREGKHREMSGQRSGEEEPSAAWEARVRAESSAWPHADLLSSGPSVCGQSSC